MNKYFAKLDDNVVIDIIVVNENDAPDENAGIKFLINLYNNSSENWKMFNRTGHDFRGNPAHIEGTWDEINQVFWAPPPYPSWTKNTNDWQWHPPVPYPSVTETYIIAWDEDNLVWKACKIDEYTETYNWDPNTSSWNQV